MENSSKVTAQHFMPMTYKGVAQYGILIIEKPGHATSELLFNLGSEGAARRASFILFFAAAQGFECTMLGVTTQCAEARLPEGYNLPRRKPVVITKGAALEAYAAHLQKGLYIPVCIMQNDDTDK